VSDAAQVRADAKILTKLLGRTIVGVSLVREAGCFMLLLDADTELYIRASGIEFEVDAPEKH